MPTPCNLWVTDIEGSSEKDGREGSSDVFEISHGLHSPIDPDTGQATGPRVHKPLSVVKVVDKATPMLHKSLCEGKNIPEVKLVFYRIDPSTRAETEYYMIIIKQARVVDIRPYMPMSFVPANESYRHMEQVNFVYEEIEWNWMPDSVVEMDSWRSPGV